MTDAISSTQFVDAAKNLSPEQKKLVVQNLIGRPTKVNGLYWLVLGTACVILLLCVMRLTGVFLMMNPAAPASFWALFPDVDKIVGIFTTVLSFVVGLFVPSPLTASGNAGEVG